MSDGFETFYDTVKGRLWPRFATNKDELRIVWESIERCGIMRVGEVLIEHKREHPDAYKPNWGEIRAVLYKSDGAASNRSELSKMLAAQRRHLERFPVAGKPRVSDWHDADVYDYFVRAQTQHLFVDGYGRPVAHGDADRPRRERLAMDLRTNIAHGYIVDLEERGDRVPDWLCPNEVREAIGALPLSPDGYWSTLVTQGAGKDSHERKRKATKVKAVTS